MDELERAHAAAGPCPSCGAVAARPIVYGMPSARDYERLEGQVVFAGCSVPSPAPAFSCGSCAFEWGSVRSGAPERSRDVFAELDEA